MQQKDRAGHYQFLGGCMVNNLLQTSSYITLNNCQQCPDQSLPCSLTWVKVVIVDEFTTVRSCQLEPACHSNYSSHNVLLTWQTRSYFFTNLLRCNFGYQCFILDIPNKQGKRASAQVTPASSETVIPPLRFQQILCPKQTAWENLNSSSDIIIIHLLTATRSHTHKHV